MCLVKRQKICYKVSQLPIPFEELAVVLVEESEVEVTISVAVTLTILALWSAQIYQYDTIHQYDINDGTFQPPLLY